MSEDYVANEVNVQNLMIDFLCGYGEYSTGGSVKVVIDHEQDGGWHKDTHTIDVVELIAFVYSKIKKGGEV